MKLRYVLWFYIGFYASSALAAPKCIEIFNYPEISIQPRPELMGYESTRNLDLKPQKDFRDFAPQQGIFVTNRDKNGKILRAFIRVLSDNPNNRIEVIGDFNDWGKSGTVVLHSDFDPIYAMGEIKGLKHGDQYRLVVNGKPLLDASSLAYSTPGFNQKMYGRATSYLNSVFWDIEGAGKYEHKNPIVDLRKKAMAITETEMHALVAKFNGGPISTQDTYNFIADSGVITQLKNRGINAIEFLPFNAAADGDSWQIRYQIFGPFAIESKYGTPAEFARMVDKFNEAGISVIMDVLLSHYQFDANEGERNLKDIGLSNWKKADGQNLYGSVLTQWNTFRYDYRNPYIRRYLIDSILNTIKYFHIGGLRLDNYDGIRFLPGGTEFLKQLVAEVRAYAPQIWINAEMFLPENAVTKRLDWDGHGMNSYNNGNFFWNVVRSLAQKRTEELNMDTIQGLLRDQWRWNEAMRLFYVTNHDEAANRLEGATGAYFATLVNGGGWQYVEGKTRVFATLAMMSGSYYLDMPQLRIMQEGSFSLNPAIEWDVLKYPSQQHMDKYFADLSNYFTSNPAFAPHNLHSNIENHIDQNNKVISLERIDFATGKRVYILINMGDRGLNNYAFGVSADSKLKVVIDNNGKTQGPDLLVGGGMHGKAHSVLIPYVPPYGVVILEN